MTSLFIWTKEIYDHKLIENWKTMREWELCIYTACFFGFFDFWIVQIELCTNLVQWLFVWKTKTSTNSVCCLVLSDKPKSVYCLYVWQIDLSTNSVHLLFIRQTKFGTNLLCCLFVWQIEHSTNSVLHLFIHQTMFGTNLVYYFFGSQTGLVTNSVLIHNILLKILIICFVRSSFV